MTLHIALDGLDGLGKTTQVKKLKEFLTRNSYNVKTLIQPQDKTILSILKDYNLTLSEIALLMAIDRSLTLNYENLDNYDIIIWDRSILSSYAYNTNENVKASFIKQINKFFPEMDIYIVIRNDKILDHQDYTNQKQNELVKKYDILINNHPNVFKVDYIHNDPDKVFKNIVDLIFTELPTCRWCGKLFTKSVSNKKYCSDKCRDYAKEEQNRDNFREYYKRYKDTMSESQRGALGSRGANLHGKANKDPKIEYKLISNEKRRLGL